MGIKAANEPKGSTGPYDDDDPASLNVNSVSDATATLPSIPLISVKRLVNPFMGKTHEEMDDLIDRFMEKTRIDEIYSEHIRKGAYLAQDHDAFDDLREDGLQLKPEERAALVMEDPKRGNKWNQPWIMYALIGCCSLGAAVQGWDEVSDTLPLEESLNTKS